MLAVLLPRQVAYLMREAIRHREAIRCNQSQGSLELLRRQVAYHLQSDAIRCNQMQSN